MQKTFFAAVGAACFFVLGCGDVAMGDPTNLEPSAVPCDPSAQPSRTVSSIESFAPGVGSGYGADRYPQVIFGEPIGNGKEQGGIDVLSLGRGGEIVLGFCGNAIVDGPGVDFIVFENPFLYGANGAEVFSEPGEVSVSADGETWNVFPCEADATPPRGCAGLGPVLANGDVGISSTDPSAAGGDQFDLATIGVTEARYVRIRDVKEVGAAPTAGFDLDAVSIVNALVP